MNMTNENNKPLNKLIEKAWSMFFKKKYEESEAVFTEVFEKQKVNDALYGRACAYFKMKAYEEALEDLNLYIKNNSDNFKGYHLRGLVYGSMNKTNKALSDFEKTIELQPDYAAVYFDMGGCYLLMKEYQMAYDCFDRSLSRDNSSAEAWFGKGMASLMQKEYSKAVEYFSIALKIDKKFKLALLGRCEAFDASGKAKEFQNDLKKLHKLDPELFTSKKEYLDDEFNNDDFDDESEIEDFTFDD